MDRLQQKCVKHNCTVTAKKGNGERSFCVNLLIKSGDAFSGKNKGDVPLPTGSVSHYTPDPGVPL